MQKVITHSGPFHADDVFAVASLQLHFGQENLEVIRTRDEAVMATGDIVVDVGAVYDPDHQRFDHHQVGAPVRDNGIPYAGFGLIWKHYGEQICNSKTVAESVEKSLVFSVDAADNGVSLYQTTEIGVSPTTISDIVSLFNPIEGTTSDQDQAFLKAVDFARDILGKAIARAKAKELMKEIAHSVYQSSQDKEMLVFDVPMSKALFIEYPEVKFIVSPDNPASSQNWLATAIQAEYGSFALRQRFPEEWGGLRDEELAKVSGIADAVFCHKAGFLFVSKTKEGALAAVEKTRN